MAHFGSTFGPKKEAAPAKFWPGLLCVLALNQEPVGLVAALLGDRCLPVQAVQVLRPAFGLGNEDMQPGLGEALGTVVRVILAEYQQDAQLFRLALCQFYQRLCRLCFGLRP